MFKRFWWIFPLSLVAGPVLGLLTAAILAYTAADEYISTTVLQIRPPAEPSFFLGASDPHASVERFLNTEIELMRSASLIRGVADRLDLGKHWDAPEHAVLNRLQQAIQVRKIRGTDLVEISVRTSDPSNSQRIAESLSEIYREHRRETSSMRAEAALKELHQAVKEQEDLVETKRKALTAMMRNGPAVRSDAAPAEKSLRRFEFDDAKADFETAQSLLEKLKIRLISEQMQGRIAENAVVIHSEPTAASNPASHHWLKFLVIGAAGGLMLGLLSPFLIIPVAHKALRPKQP